MTVKSVEAVTEFAQQLGKDRSLQEEFKATVGNKEGMAANQAVADLAAKHGYNFSSEDAAEVHQQLRQSEMSESDESDELSEESLEAIAGGGEIGKAIGSWLGDKAEELIKKW
jgi:hypothetical protein